MGPLGSGKTIQSCLKVFTLMCEQAPNKEKIRPSRWYAVRNTYPDLKTTTIKDWLGVHGELGKMSWDHPPTHKLDFDLEDGTRVVSEVVFIALDRPDSVKKLRGAQATGFWLNEVKEIPKPIVDMADLRHGRYPSMAVGGTTPTWHGMIGDTNAPDDDHWYYELAEEQQPEGWEFFRQPGGLLRRGDGWTPNPEAENINNLPPNYYVAGMQGKSRDWVAVNLANEYGTVQDGKPVYPEYNNQIHSTEEELLPYKGLPLILGWDYGLTPAVVFMQITPRGQLRVIDELVSEDMGVEQFSRDIVKPHIGMFYPDMQLLSWGDPGGDQRAQTDEKTCMDILKDQGIPTRPARSNKSEARKSPMRAFLTKLVDGKPGFLISSACPITRKGLNGGYKYERVMVAGEERYKDQPLKNKYSHPVEALEYGAMSVHHPDMKKAPMQKVEPWQPLDKSMGW